MSNRREFITLGSSAAGKRGSVRVSVAAAAEVAERRVSRGSTPAHRAASGGMSLVAAAAGAEARARSPRSQTRRRSSSIYLVVSKRTSLRLCGCRERYDIRLRWQVAGDVSIQSSSRTSAVLRAGTYHVCHLVPAGRATNRNPTVGASRI